MKTSKKFIDIVNKGNIEEAKKFVDNSSFLFKGPCGIRHIDFVAYKDDLLMKKISNV